MLCVGADGEGESKSRKGCRE